MIKKLAYLLAFLIFVNGSIKAQNEIKQFKNSIELDVTNLLNQNYLTSGLLYTRNFNKSALRLFLTAKYNNRNSTIDTLFLNKQQFGISPSMGLEKKLNVGIIDFIYGTDVFFSYNLNKGKLEHKELQGQAVLDWTSTDTKLNYGIQPILALKINLIKNFSIRFETNANLYHSRQTIKVEYNDITRDDRNTTSSYNSFNFFNTLKLYVVCQF